MEPVAAAARAAPRAPAPDVHHPQTGNALYVFALPGGNGGAQEARGSILAR